MRRHRAQQDRSGRHRGARAPDGDPARPEPARPHRSRRVRQGGVGSCAGHRPVRLHRRRPGARLAAGNARHARTRDRGIRHRQLRPRARRPFHPERFFAWIEDEWPGVVRSKGFFWLASHPTMVGSWSQAGAVARHGVAGYWWASAPPEHWPQDPEAVAAIKQYWDEEVGDARQEIVLIGMDMDEAALRTRFDSCLLTDEEMALGPQAWTGWHNPFPDWP
ncbi:GTP-binding protein [Thauera sp. SDU_THAU2]|uniref:GTP-binding protein n=1 Tax=Thauera sp. SDU_THAU2 TaxID=3136633 RepID=UPI00311F5A99